MPPVHRPGSLPSFPFDFLWNWAIAFRKKHLPITAFSSSALREVASLPGYLSDFKQTEWGTPSEGQKGCLRLFVATKTSTHTTFIKYQLCTESNFIWAGKQHYQALQKGCRWSLCIFQPVAQLSVYSVPALANMRSPEKGIWQIQLPLLPSCPGQPLAVSWASLSLWPDNGLGHSLLFQKGLDLLAKLQGGCIDVPQRSFKVVWVFW